MSQKLGFRDWDLGKTKEKTSDDVRRISFKRLIRKYLD